MSSKSIVMAVFACILSVNIAQAAIVNPGDVYRMDFDFSSDPFSGPYSNAAYSIFFGSDALDNGANLNVSLYDSSDIFYGSGFLTGSASNDINIEIGSGFGLVSPMTDTIGYVLLTSTATFELLDFSLMLLDSSGSLWTEKALLPITQVVPVPAAAWLFGSGLIGLIGIARRKKV